ncbi:MAG: hypothetical protein HRU07_05810 [Nitrosopumilus sp.]|nr:hypothetical protein [Nitrosopumilus sp.]NRA05661.1 hypothetical protein [Nitrosopumilus sp.]
MAKPSSVTNKIKKEFRKKDILTLDEIYSILFQDEELKAIGPNLKHRIRSSIYMLKKNATLELIDKGTYKIINKKGSEGFDPST